MKKFIAVSLSSFALLALFGCQQKPVTTEQPVITEKTNAMVDIKPAEERTATSTASLVIGGEETQEVKSAADDRSASLKANVTIGTEEEKSAADDRSAALKANVTIGTEEAVLTDVMAEPSL